MTAAEIQQRVDACLDARSAWLGQDSARWSLASQWQAVSRQFGADSPAALGVLLGLVREAWGDPTLTPDFIPIGSPRNDEGFPFWFCWVEWPNNDPSPGVSRTEAGGLLAALEAAP